MTITSNYVVLGTSEGDILTTSSDSLTLLIQVVNTTGSSVTAELWITNGSNTHYYPLLVSQTITASNGIKDTGKYEIPSGYKVRGLSSVSSGVYTVITIASGINDA